MPRLELLRLSLNAISPETLAQLAAQKQLAELALRDVPLTDAQLARLMGGLPQLQRLALRRVNGVSDAGLHALKLAPRLEVLALVEMSITGNGLAGLQQLPRLRSLDLRKCEALTADDYGRLAAVKSLRELKLAGSSIGDAVLAAVAVMPSLDALVVEDSPVSAEAIQRLSTVAGLPARMQSLTLTRCYGVTDDALGVLLTMPRLQALSIRRCPVAGEFLTRWANLSAEKLPKLRTLVVNDAFLPDGAVAVLPRFAVTLKRLSLSRVPLSPAAMTSIGELARLESLESVGVFLDRRSDQAARESERAGDARPLGQFWRDGQVGRVVARPPPLEARQQEAKWNDVDRVAP